MLNGYHTASRPSSAFYAHFTRPHSTTRPNAVWTTYSSPQSGSDEHFLLCRAQWTLQHCWKQYVQTLMLGHGYGPYSLQNLSLFPPGTCATHVQACPSVSKRVHVPVFALFFLQKWKDMVGHGRTWRDMVGHGRTWEDMIRNGRQGKTR